MPKRVKTVLENNGKFSVFVADIYEQISWKYDIEEYRSGIGRLFCSHALSKQTKLYYDGIMISSGLGANLSLKMDNVLPYIF